MKNLIVLMALLLSVCEFSIAQNALEIIQKADAKNRGNSSRAEMSMTIVRTGWQRTVKMKTWSKGNDYFMILITYPENEKGQVFMKRGKEMWNWIPKIERMVKIPSSMMMQSWMGSDFTNDDLVQQSSIVKDYNHKLLGSEKVREEECWKIELTPKPDATVVWGKIIIWITKSGYDVWKTQYFDEDFELVSTENASNIKKMGDRSIPTRMEIIPADKPNQKTILEIISIEFNINISESFFTQQNMKIVK